MAILSCRSDGKHSSPGSLSPLRDPAIFPCGISHRLRPFPLSLRTNTAGWEPTVAA